MKEEIFKCGKCGKKISENEYCVNWGWCEDCLDNDYDDYLIENSALMTDKDLRELKIKTKSK